MSGESDSTTPLLVEQNTKNVCHFGAVYKQNSEGGSVTLNFPTRLRNYSERDRARTVSSLAPLPDSCYTINTFLFFLTCFQLMNLLTLTYTDSVINYIAKRFVIPNTMASFIPSAYQLGSMLVIIPVSYYGRNFNRPKAIGIGVMIMVVGLAFCVLPHFILPAPEVPKHSANNLCKRNSIDGLIETDDSNDIQESVLLSDNLPCNKNGTVYNPALLLIIGQALFGIGSTPLWPLGVSYIDDHVVLRKVPIYLGIFIGTTLTGPVFGFLLGSVSSAIYVDLEGKQLHQSNPGYIGAWWLGYLIAMIILIILLFPFYFYPRSLPLSPQKRLEIEEIEALQQRREISRGQSMLEDEQEDRLEQEHLEAEREDADIYNCENKFRAYRMLFSKITDLLSAMKRTLSTPLVLTAFISYTAVANLLSGVATFGSSYLQMIFNVYRTTSDMLIGGICLPLGIIGTIAGGFIVKKYNFGIRTSLKFVLVMCAVSCVLFASLFPCGCEPLRLAGLTVPYQNTTVKSLENVCNDNCFCPKGEFELICGLDKTTYISPCFAGCLSKTKKKDSIFKELVTYHNCTCVRNEVKEANKGPCSTDHCRTVLGVFIVGAGVGMFFLCLCQAPVYVILLRMLNTEDKSLGIGLMSFISRLLGYIPGPIWYGMILDRSCIYWSPKCMGKSVCFLYNTIGLRYSYMGISVAWAFIYFLVFSISFLWMETHPGHYEKSIQPLELGQSASSGNDNEHNEDDLSNAWR